MDEEYEEIEEKPRMIKVIVKQPNGDPEIKEVPNAYEEMAEFCHGFIGMGEMPFNRRINYIVNDSSLVNGMEPNIVLPEYENLIAGPVIFAGNDDEGNTISLTDEQIEKVMKYIGRNQVFYLSMEGAYIYMMSMSSGFEKEKELEMEV